MKIQDYLPLSLCLSAFLSLDCCLSVFAFHAEEKSSLPPTALRLRSAHHTPGSSGLPFFGLGQAVAQGVRYA